MDVRVRSIALVLAVAMGCTHPNPAFDDGATAGAVGGSGAAGPAGGSGGGGGAGAGGNSGGRGGSGAAGAGGGSGGKGAGGVGNGEPIMIPGPITPPTNGLVAHFRFDETGGTRVADSSGNGLVATLGGTGATFVPGLFGQALELSGTGFATLPDCDCLDGITSSVTIAAWAKPAALDDYFRAIASRQVQGTTEEHYFLGALGPTPVGIVSQHTGVYSSQDIVVGQWVHLATTYDGANLIVYVNGTAAGKTSVSVPLRADSTPVLIGANHNGSGADEQWIGLIDELLIYSRALSPSEVRGLAGR